MPCMLQNLRTSPRYASTQKRRFAGRAREIVTSRKNIYPPKKISPAGAL